MIAALSSRERYERYARFVTKASLTEEAYTIFSAMGDWFAANKDAQRIDWNSFAAWYVLVRHAKLHKDKLQAHKALIEIVAGMDEEASPMEALLNGLITREYGTKVAEVALRIADGDYNQSLDGIRELLDDYDKATGRLDERNKKLGAFGAEAIESVNGPGLQWRLTAFNDSFGPVRQGDFIVFGKRPDAGGTTMMASEVSYMVDDLEPGECILWVNNEEAGNKVRSRIIQARIGWTTEDMLADPKGAWEAYKESLPDPQAIVVYDDAKAHTKDVEAICKERNPRLIIADQLWKFKGFKGDDEKDRMTEAGNWGRELAKEYCGVIAVHQLGTEADNQMWNGYERLYGSKTGLQGEADCIVTMGRVYSHGNYRYLFFPKNKSTTPGNKDRRNGKWKVRMLGDIARYEDVSYEGL